MAALRTSPKFMIPTGRSMQPPTKTPLRAILSENRRRSALRGVYDAIFNYLTKIRKLSERVFRCGSPVRPCSLFARRNLTRCDASRCARAFDCTAPRCPHEQGRNDLLLTSAGRTRPDAALFGRNRGIAPHFACINTAPRVVAAPDAPADAPGRQLELDDTERVGIVRPSPLKSSGGSDKSGRSTKFG